VLEREEEERERERESVFVSVCCRPCESVGRQLRGMLRGIGAIRYENLLFNILSNLSDDAFLPFPCFLLNFCQRDCDAKGIQIVLILETKFRYTTHACITMTLVISYHFYYACFLAF